MSAQQEWNALPPGDPKRRERYFAENVAPVSRQQPSSSLASARNFSQQSDAVSRSHQPGMHRDASNPQWQAVHHQQLHRPPQSPKQDARFGYSDARVAASPSSLLSSPAPVGATWNLSSRTLGPDNWQSPHAHEAGSRYHDQSMSWSDYGASAVFTMDTRNPTSHYSPSYPSSLYDGPWSSEPMRLPNTSSNSLNAAWKPSSKERPIPSASFYAQRAPPNRSHAAGPARPAPSQAAIQHSIAPPAGMPRSRPSSSALPISTQYQSHPPSLGNAELAKSVRKAAPHSMASQPQPQTPPQSARPLPSALQDSPDPLSFFSPYAPTPTWDYVRPPVQRPLPPPQPSFMPFQNTQSQAASLVAQSGAPIAPKRKDLQDVAAPKKLKKKVKAAVPTRPLKEETFVYDDRKDNNATEPNSGIVAQREPPVSTSSNGHDLPFVELAHEQDDFGSQKARLKKKRLKRHDSSSFDLLSGLVEDSDSGLDAEGSDWHDLDVIETWNSSSMANTSDIVTPDVRDNDKFSTGPVRSSLRKYPLEQLQGFMEDLFEADDSLPDTDTLQNMPAEASLSHDVNQLFEVTPEPSISGGGRRMTILRASALQKLLKLTVKCSLPLSEISGTSRKSLSSGPSGLSSIPMADLVRLLAIVERTAKAAEYVDPFPTQSSRQNGSELSSSPKKKKPRANGHISRSPSKSPAASENAASLEQTQTAQPHEPDAEVGFAAHQGEHGSGDPFEALNASLVLIHRSTLAVECCLCILSGDILPKQVISEDVVRTCFETIKASLDRVVLPFIESCSGAAPTAPHPMLTQLVDVLAPHKPPKKKSSQAVDDTAQGVGSVCRNTLSDLFHHLCSALFFVQRIVKMASVTLSDSIVISAVYLALGPFFVLEPEPGGGSGTGVAARGRSALASIGGANAMKSLRLPALHLLRNIFANSPDQRQWMIEEILTSLTRLTDLKKHRRQYSLRNGKAIHSINALLLQLIQGASHGVSAYARGSADRFNRAAERKDVDVDTTLTGEIHADAMQAELAIWRRGLEGANQSARSIATYLMQNVGQSKVAKASLEMSHTLIIENSIQDLLNALFLPEWPAAALMLSAFCRTFATFLEDPKSSPDAKGVALEQVGLVATRLRQSHLTLKDADAERPAVSHVATLGDTHSSNRWDRLSISRALAELNVSAVTDFVQHCTLILQFLSKSASDDQSTEGAFDFLIVQAQGELAVAHAKATDVIADTRANTQSDSTQLSKALAFKQELETGIATLSRFEITESGSAWVPDESNDKALVVATLLSETLTMTSSSMITYEALQDLLIEGLNSQLIANRSKSLRGIDKIAQIDPDILDQASVRAAIEVRLRDSSNAVRESAVSLFGSYMLRKPQHLPVYYKQLAARIHDTGLSVRKRMVRLLKSIHETTSDWDIRIDACVRIVRCINDEDTVVQDLVVSTIGELWLDLESGDVRRSRRARSPAVDVAKSAAATDRAGDDQLSAADEEKMSDTINVIMAVAEVLKERPSPFEEVFRRIFKDRSQAEAADLHSKVQKLGDSMINGLVEASEISTVDTVKRIRIVQLLVSTNPAILTISKAKMLLPYLTAAQTSEEVQIMDLLLRIFRSCLPHMPKTALAFAEALEKSLRPLVNRPPPKAGLHLLQELIACYCAVITLHTHNFRLLIQTLKACFVRVQSMRQMALKGEKVEAVKAWSTLMSLTASLCEHADFDSIRVKHPDTTAEIDALCKRPLVDVVSEALLDIQQHGSEAVRSVALQNLGFIFRAYPTTMTRPTMTSMMDSIFAQGSSQDRATLLKIILEFLNAESIRRDPDHTVTNVGGARRKQADAGAGSIDMTVLVGNTETFADTGVGAAMMQRYSEHVLKASLEVQNPSLQRTAVDILRYTVLNGLSHPIQCVPYLVSLETLEDRKLRSRALELHSHLASKHASLIQARFLDSARSAFRYQLSLSVPETLRGFRIDTAAPVAMLDSWYTLLRDRRAIRLDFLRQIVKAMDVNTAASDCSVDETLFARFIADNLATLDYKTMEEILTVVAELRSILAVSGMQVLYMIQSHLPQDQLLPVGQVDANDGARTPPRAVIGTTMSSLVSPMGIARNPWLAEAYDNAEATEQLGPELSENRPAVVDAITVARMSLIAGTALLLRNHLKNLYGLSEARCSKFNPSKKQSAGADKPATMRALSDPMQTVLDLNSTMPFALTPIGTTKEAVAQMTAYAAMVETEGTMMEPDDADMMDDFF